MISDRLADTIFWIDLYLKDYPHVYTGKMRDNLRNLRDHMEAIVHALDQPTEKLHAALDKRIRHDVPNGKVQS